MFGGGGGRGNQAVDPDPQICQTLDSDPDPQILPTPDLGLHEMDADPNSGRWDHYSTQGYAYKILKLHYLYRPGTATSEAQPIE